MNNQLTPVERIKACGLRVYMRNPNDEYCYYTDGVNIGYAQWTAFRGEHVSTVHMPSHVVGTGFQFADGIINEELIRAALTCVAPNWVSGRDAANVRKWKNWDAFVKASSFNAGFHEV